MIHNDKKIENIIDKVMAADDLEQTPLDFTGKVMMKIEMLSTSKSMIYKPLISKFGWALIVGGFITLIGYMYFKTPSSNISWIQKLGLSNVSINPFKNITLNISTILMYAVAFFAIMLSIQIPILKNYFNKRMTF